MLEKHPMPDQITGKKIKLVARTNHIYDADYWHEIEKNRSFLQEYLPWVNNTNSIQDCFNATDMFTNMWASGEIFAYSIILPATDKAIGSIDIHNIDYDNHSAEIGYCLAKEHNGFGYMSEAVKLIENQALP